jgi:hypothetical protein
LFEWFFNRSPTPKSLNAPSANVIFKDTSLEVASPASLDAPRSDKFAVFLMSIVTPPGRLDSSRVDIVFKNIGLEVASPLTLDATRS